MDIWLRLVHGKLNTVKPLNKGHIWTRSVVSFGLILKINLDKPDGTSFVQRLPLFLMVLFIRVLLCV